MESRIGFLFRSTSLHGFKHLTPEDAPTWKKGFARVFWTTFIALSFFFMTGFLKETIDKTKLSTSINVDTSYRDWENVFPAVSICLTRGRSTAPIKKYMEANNVAQTLGIKSLQMRHYRAIQSVLFLNYVEPLEGVNIDHCMELNDTCGVDFDIIRRAIVPGNCTDIFKEVQFLGRPIDCSKYFISFDTELGKCFVANSIYSYPDSLDDFNKLPLKYSNTLNKPITLNITYFDNDFYGYKLLIHTPEELPDGKLEHSVLRKKGSFAYVAIKTAEFHNHHDVRQESMESRNCRFPSERYETFNLPYSINYCKYIDRVQREMKTCNCTLPIGYVTDHKLPYCNLENFTCIDTLANKLRENLKNKTAAQEILKNCITYPSCLTMEITKVGELEQDFENVETGNVVIEVIDKPIMRYIRRVTVTKLDLMGG
jgi:acid-sensing ion channel, other